MRDSFRFAMCNEAFEGRPFAEVCGTLRRLGYEGIEIAPFTLAPDPLEITAAQRREYCAIMADEELGFVGLHWLLVTKKPIHVSTPDKALREQSWQHVKNLIDLCGDLAGRETPVMVFGSPKQRSTVDGLTPPEATRNFTDGLAGVAPHAEARGVTILVEALPRSQSDVINTLEDAAEVVRQIDSTAVRTMFDTHNTEDETEDQTSLLARYSHLIRHVHVNEMDGRHPGMFDPAKGGYEFAGMLGALHRLGYQGWVSVEAFDFSYGAERIAAESMEYLKMQRKRALEWLI